MNKCHSVVERDVDNDGSVSLALILRNRSCHSMQHEGLPSSAATLNGQRVNTVVRPHIFRFNRLKDCIRGGFKLAMVHRPDSFCITNNIKNRLVIL
jgi:hypothetical protein